MRKVYIAVTADFDGNGRILPRSFTWEDGKHYTIDRVKDIRQAASLKVGVIGLRYLVSICGKEVYMWLENGSKWFMDGK